MTSITKLSNLEKYNSKMMNYIHDTFLTKSTPKEIEECFGDLIDNFTGRGLIKSGNVQIDENGIASGFTTSSNYIKFTCAEDGKFYSHSHIFQSKLKLTNTTQGGLLFHAEVAQFWCGYCIMYNSKTITFGTETNKVWKTINIDISNVNVLDWFYLKIDYNEEEQIIEISVYDNDMYLKANVKQSFVIPPLTKDVYYLRLSGDRFTNTNNPSNVIVDLSETWFKDKDGNLISSWNK